MNVESINKTRKNCREQRRIIHCITNPISINQCANAILAVGASPMMAQHPDEVQQITATAGALVLNLGNITDTRMCSILKSAQTAKEKGIPIVIDLVGISCSDLRHNFVCQVINLYKPDVIKGNYSEITAFYNNSYKSAGVDADTAISVPFIEKISSQLAQKYGFTVLASGKTDIITDGVISVKVNNCTPQLAQVTGTGCMLGALCGAYISVSDAFSAAVTACAVMGVCGNLSQTDKGNGTFMVNLMDSLSTLTDENINTLLDMEVKGVGV